MTSILKVSTIQNTAGTAPTAADLGLNVTGSVLQVLQARDNTTTTISNTTASLAGGLTITPSSTSSKILLTATINLGQESSTPNWVGFFRRGVTDLGYFTDSNRMGGLVMAQTRDNTLPTEHAENATFSYLDSPSTTSAITYYVRLSVTDGALRINRVAGGSDSAWATRGYTTITAMEIAG